MFLIRVIIVIGILWLIAAIIGWLIKAALLKRLASLRKNAPTNEAKSLVPCQTCKTYIDKTKAIEYQGAYYCCREHLDKK